MSRLFSWLLNVVYLGLIAICSPLIIWQAVRTGKYRDGYAQKFLGLAPRVEDDAPCIWLHAVSVGEVNLLATLLREWRSRRPTWKYVISTTSRAGYELACKKYAGLTVFYCPLDFSWAVRNAMRRVRPTMLVLAELELWPNLIAAAREYGARVAIINGRLSDHSFPGYRRVRPLASHMLKQIDLIAAQNDESAERFLALGALPDRVTVTGSLKYDGAQTDRRNAKTASLRALAGIAPDDIVFLAGSTQEPEEAYAIEIYRQLSVHYPQLRLILVPRHPERFNTVAELLETSGLSWCRRTELGAHPAVLPAASPSVDFRTDVPPARCGNQPANSTSGRPVVLVDTVGELGAWWGLTQIAFVGGSFGPRGGQNMIEPAAYGAAVSFGPNTRNFRDIVSAMLSADAAVVVRDAVQLSAFVRRCLEEWGYAEALGGRAAALVKSQLGATARTVDLLESMYSRDASRNPRSRQAA